MSWDQQGSGWESSAFGLLKLGHSRLGPGVCLVVVCLELCMHFVKTEFYLLLLYLVKNKNLLS